jgi:subtilisin family serine protease
LRLAEGRVLTRLTALPGQADLARAEAETLGAQITGGRGDVLQAWVPLGALEALATAPGVARLGAPHEAVSLTGGVTSQGVAASLADAWHTAGYRGEGVKIGVIDGGFTDYGTRLSTGDVPSVTPGVTARNFVDGESDAQLTTGSIHGTACVEVVYDMAPQATLLLAKIQTDIDLAEAVYWLTATHQVDVISTSLGWYGLTPGDGTGFFADLVADARAAGVTWATAAGNDAQVHWGGPWADDDADDVLNINGVQEVNYFGPGDGSAYWVAAGTPVRAFLRWDDWTAVDQDYDLTIVRWNVSDWDDVAVGADWQDGSPGQTPTEFAYYPNTQGGYYGVVVKRFSATRPAHFELFTPQMPGLDERVAARSLANLADAPAAITVGAVNVSGYALESYSSQGPTNGPGGAASGGALKPDLAAYARVANQSYTSFAGTSAATPHVAGAAALVIGRYPAYTPAQVKQALMGWAADLGAAGPDNQFGAGRLLMGSAAPSGPRFAAPASWLNGLGVAAGGWTSQNVYPRLTGDVNGDGKADVVAFGNKAVYVALSNGSKLAAPVAWLGAYGPAAGGWTSFDLYPRWVGDVNGDGRDDIVAFGNKAVYVSRSTGSGFTAPAVWLNGYGPASGGWASYDLYPRVLGDVNGDGRADIVAFGNTYVYVSLSTGSGFTAPAPWLKGMGPAAGWSSQNVFPRWVADVNGDGRADVVGFGDKAVYVALSNGSRFSAPAPWFSGYGPSAGGWTSFELFPRWLGDMNGDGKADIVAFGNTAVYVSLSSGAGFGPAQAALSAYGPAAGGWTGYDLFPRILGDLTGDGRADIVAFGNKATYGSPALE